MTMALVVWALFIGCQVREETRAPEPANGRTKAGYFLFDKPFKVDSGLGSPGWRKELQMTKEQSDEATRLQRLDNQLYASMMDDRAAGKTEAQVQHYVDRMMKSRSEILNLLTENQKKRLFQLQLQKRGLSYAASRRDFVAEMKLTENQLIQIHETNVRHRGIRSNLRKKMQSNNEIFRLGTFGSKPPDIARKLVNEYFQKSYVSWQKAEAKDLAEEEVEQEDILDSEQRAKWRKMLGRRYVEPIRVPGRP
jgi:hypothetical protein